MKLLGGKTQNIYGQNSQLKMLETFLKYFLTLVLYPKLTSKDNFIFMVPDMDYFLRLGSLQNYNCLSALTSLKSFES